MSGIEVRAFGKLYFLFKERGWPSPKIVHIANPLTVDELREQMQIQREDVEAAFVNRVVEPFSFMVKEGDRVAFVPPGIPSIHRFNLGFYKNQPQDTGK